MSRKCFIRDLWYKFTPYLQIGGYFVMLGSILSGVYVCVQFVDKASEAMAAVSELQEFKADTKVSIAVMQQEVHDIHEYLCGKNCK